MNYPTSSMYILCKGTYEVNRVNGGTRNLAQAWGLIFEKKISYMLYKKHECKVGSVIILAKIKQN